MDETLLTLDSSTTVCSLAVSRGEKILGEITLDPGKNHSELLLPSLGGLLRALDLHLGQVDGFGVVVGPGSFTGLRVGIGTIQGLAFAQQKPVVGVSSLQTLAAQCPLVSLPLVALLDARKGEVYAGCFCWTGGVPEPLGPEAVLPPEAVIEKIDGETIFIGSGALRYRSLIVRRLGARAHFVPWNQNNLRASAAAMLALEVLRRGEGVSGEEIFPRYLRLSEAEINWSKREANGAIQG